METPFKRQTFYCLFTKTYFLVLCGLKYLTSTHMDRRDFLKALKQHGIENDIPNVSLANACFLRGLIRKNNTQSLLEIGSANGYSTIHFACEIENTGGKITSIEFSQVAYEDAQENFKKAQVDHMIQSYF